MLPPLTIFDIETTGLDPLQGHRIIEIAGVRMENGSILRNSAFTTYVNPERDIPWEARQINRIRDEDVKDAPTIDSVLPKFLEFAAGSLLIAHNAAFDYGFLEAEKQFCWGYTYLPECLCTMELSKSLYPRNPGHSLDVVARRFNLTMPPERHRALADAILAAEAFKRMIEAGNIRSMDELRQKAAFRQVMRKYP